MKISPVVGTPTLPNPSQSGLGNEKLDRIKSIARGENPEPTDSAVELKKALDGTQSIKMNVNRTPGLVEQPIPEPEAPLNAQEIIKSDTDSTANVGVEAIKPLSPQLAALARERRALQVKAKEIAEREKALSGQSRADLEARIKSQPLDVLQELGVTYDQLTQAILGQKPSEPNPEILALKEEIKALKEGVDKTFATQAEQNEMSALSQMADEAEALMASSDEFETIRETNGLEKVLRRIYDTYKKSGKVMDVVEALRLTEQEEFESTKAILQKVKKLQSALQPVVPAPQKPVQGIRTLTNKDSARPSMDRKQRAILAAMGQLPKG